MENYDVFYNYMDLIRQGVPFRQAAEQSGLLNATRDAGDRFASQQQANQWANLGGRVVGRAGTQAVKDWYQNKPILGEAREGISQAGTKLANAFGFGDAGLAQSAAENAAWNAQAGAAQNAAWNASADAATAAAGGSTAAPTAAPKGLLAPGSKLAQGLGAVGFAMGAHGAYKGVKAGDPISAGSSALSAGLGLNAMGMALGPIGWGLMLAAPIAGAFINKNKVSSRERNKRQTENLLKMGFSPQTLQNLGRLDAQGNKVYFPDTQTKEEKDASGREWDRITRSSNKDENPFRVPTAMWTYEGMLNTFGPDYMEKWSEKDRYIATAATIEQGGGFYNKKGEVLAKDQDKARAAFEAVKADPLKYGQLEAAYNNWKATGVDSGIDWSQEQKDKWAADELKEREMLAKTRADNKFLEKDEAGNFIYSSEKLSTYKNRQKN